MAIDCNQLQAYAKQFLPQFVFDTSERVFPVSIESWLTHCAEDDWSDPTSPHRGTADIVATLPLQLNGLMVGSGCNGTAGSPIDPSNPLASYPGVEEESFLDFAGWPSLATNDGFVVGDDTYIRSLYSAWFTKFNGALATGEPTPPTRTPLTLPTKVAIYCEGAWAGDFTRLAIQSGLGDFASPATNDPSNLTPDPRLDPYFVLTYYLFYPCTEPPPATSTYPVTSPNQLSREGQWEAVSLYFKSTSASVTSAADLTLASDPSTVTPDFAVLSLGITNSGDGRSVAGLATSYPAQSGTWSEGGQTVVGGGLFGGKEIVPKQVYVTAGTHKNLFSPTPTSSTSTPDQGWTATGGVLEGTGGALLPAWPVGTIIGALLLLAGFLMQFFGRDTTTTQLPDSSGDLASSNGPVANAGAPGTLSGAPSVDIDLSTFSLLPGNTACPPPAWWNYPGRWGVAVASAQAGWDSGGRRFDYKGRSRAYWNTVWLQTTLG